jgi:predicted small lipoprotein YifL
MKTVRLLLAALSLAALAACGTQSIIGPEAPGARRDVTPVDPATITETTIQSTPPGTTCEGTVVVTTDAYGNTIVTCQTDTRAGGYMGSGG